MIIRIKQFLRGIFGKITSDDRKFIEGYLDEYELNLFRKLSRYEKLHTIAVAKKTEEMVSSQKSFNKRRVIRGALLHDIGKIKCSVNIIEKSIIVICNKFLGEKMIKSGNRKLKNHYFHGEIGYEILKEREFEYEDELLNIVRYHHSQKFKGKNHIEVELIKEIDSIT